MSSTPSAAPQPDPDWPQNYFNYFTEIEEHFQRARSSGLFLLSPLDWALIEAWKDSGVPLQAVLKGIDESFDKWRSRKQRRRSINSLAYCAQAVMEAAERAPSSRDRNRIEPAFQIDELRLFLNTAHHAISQRTETPFVEITSSLRAIVDEIERHAGDAESLERRLTSLEEKLVATVRSLQTEEDLLAIREALDRELKPYRSKMSAEQLAMLERRYLDTALLERARLPRLSLFYLQP